MQSRAGLLVPPGWRVWGDQTSLKSVNKSLKVSVTTARLQRLSPCLPISGVFKGKGGAVCGAQDCSSMARAVSQLMSLWVAEVWTFKSVSCGGHSAERSGPRGRTGSRAAPLPHSAA